jgi:o-succinylbenzoate synthase
VQVHRMGGLTEVCRVVRLAREHGVRLWAGTMPESGLGSQAALAAAALPGVVYPSDLEPSTRWFGPAADVIELRMAPDGTMEVPATSVAHRLDQAVFRRTTRRLD